MLSDDSPRGRLVDAMAASIAEKGLPATTVADVCRLARTSRRTFYEHFASRDDCYFALLGVLNDEVIARIVAAVDVDAEVPVQVRQAVQAWIDGSTAHPELTLSWIRDAPSLTAGRAIQLEGQRRFIDLIGGLAAGPRFRDAHGAPPQALVVVLVGGLRELIARQVESGEPLQDLVDVAVTATLALVDTF